MPHPLKTPASKAYNKSLEVLCGTLVALVRDDTRDLSTRQLGVFLTCYLSDEEHTVRGLAGELNVSSTVITRAIDRLEHAELARRQVNPKDHRSVLVKRTLKGAEFLRALRGIMAGAATPAQIPHTTPLFLPPRVA